MAKVMEMMVYIDIFTVYLYISRLKCLSAPTAMTLTAIHIF